MDDHEEVNKFIESVKRTEKILREQYQKKFGKKPNLNNMRGSPIDILHDAISTDTPIEESKLYNGDDL